MKIPMNKHVRFIKWTNNHPFLWWGPFISLGLVIASCDARPQKVEQEAAANLAPLLTYIRDDRTGYCFAVIQTMSGWDFLVNYLGLVPIRWSITMIEQSHALRIRIVHRDQSIPHNRHRWTGKTNWRQLRVFRGWCILIVWQGTHP